MPKRQRRFDGFDQQVLSLYAKGMTLSDIRMQLQELYHGADISESVISHKLLMMWLMMSKHDKIDH
uniref:transposase n=1 Tax=Spiroplasma endosymbiont of Cleonymus obscurus TaxID=3066324 RepID=UPI0037DBF1AC